MVFAGLVAILDSQFASVANMTGHDLFNQFKQGTDDKDIITYARLGMVTLAIAGLLIANIPGMKLVWLFLFFAVLRAAVWLPSMMSLLKPNWVTEQGMFWGILIAAVPGEALFVWGKMFGGGSAITFTGTLVAILGAPILTIIFSKMTNETNVGVVNGATG